MTSVRAIMVREDEAGMRLDRWFKTHFPQLRHGELEKLLRKGQIRVDGRRCKANRRIHTGETIRVPPLPDQTSATENLQHSSSPSDLAQIAEITIFEDDTILVLNKPFGLAVQGGSKTSRHIDGILAGAGEPRPRLTHRLDRDTGGVLVLAKTRRAAQKLGQAFQQHEIEKEYWALCAGAPRPRNGTIDLPIAKTGHSGIEKVEAGQGRSAVTHYQIIEEAGHRATFLALRPETGRTHQLRVHCAAIGNPIIGDGKYGGAGSRIEGVPNNLHLFCRRMAFRHPVTGRRTVIDAPLTGHMLKTWRWFGFGEHVEVEWPS